MRSVALGLVSFISLIVSTSVSCALIDRGNGLIYDDVLDVTWLQNANFSESALTHSSAISWAEQLDFAGFDDWRLPTLNFSLGPNSTKSAYQFSCGSAPKDGRYNMDASGCDFGWTSTSVFHELAHLFYYSLGNIASVSSTGLWQNDVALTNHGPFSNIQLDFYWYGNDYNDESGFVFTTEKGTQFIESKTTELYAWALRDGDVINLPEKSVLRTSSNSLVVAPLNASVAVSAPNLAGMMALFCSFLGWRNAKSKFL